MKSDKKVRRIYGNHQTRINTELWSNIKQIAAAKPGHTISRVVEDALTEHVRRNAPLLILKREK